MWTVKLAICVAYDFFDMTIGRLLFPVPFSGEIGGCILCCILFGPAGMLYGLEGIDITEQLDGFIPTATIIALMNKPQELPDETALPG